MSIKNYDYYCYKTIAKSELVYRNYLLVYIYLILLFVAVLSAGAVSNEQSVIASEVVESDYQLNVEVKPTVEDETVLPST